MIPTLLLIASLASSQKVEFTAPITGQPGQFIVIRPDKVDGKSVQYLSLDQGLALFPGGLLNDPTVTVVVAMLPGTYRVLGYTARGDVPSPPALATVIIGGQPPGPPAPPAPPGPPGPPPAPPADPLGESIRGIFGGLQDNQKASKAAILAKAYKQGSQLLSDPAIKTAGDLYLAIKLLTKDLSSEDLRPIRDRLAEEIGKVLPTDSTVILEESHRKKGAELFSRITSILEALK